MNLLWLLKTLWEQPIVKYTISLYVTWLFLLFASGFERELQTRAIFNGSISKLVWLLIFIYIASTLVLLGIGSKALFPYLNAVFLAIAIWLIIKGSTGRSIFFLVITLILIPYTVVMIYNSYPLGDDVRFTAGFAAAIAKDSRWIPFKYFENDYYQLFHAEPALTYMLASTMGAPLEDVPIYYLTLKYSIYIVYILSIYEIVHKLTNSKSVACISLLLFSITPPLSLTQIVAQGVSIAFSLLTLALLPSISTGNKAIMSIVVSILAMSGILFHATYAILMVTFLLPLLFIKKLQSPYNNTRIKTTLIMTSLIGVTYWAYTYAGVSTFSGIPSSIINFVHLILGEQMPYSLSSNPWYEPSGYTYFMSWSLVPAIATSTITYIIIKVLVKKIKTEELNNILSIFGVLGIVLTAINFLARQATSLGGRYFYWLYLLILPYASQSFVEKFQRKFIVTGVAIAIIALIGIYGVQDPTHSANTFTTSIGWADNYSWKASTIIAPLLTSYVVGVPEQRIGTPLFALDFMFNKTISNPQLTQRNYIIIVGNDNIGLEQISISNYTSFDLVMMFSKLYAVYYVL